METKYSKESLWLINQPFDVFPPQQDPSLYAQQKIEVLLIYRCSTPILFGQFYLTVTCKQITSNIQYLFPQKRVLSPGLIRIQVSV